MKRLRNLFILILLTMSVFVGEVSAKKLAKDNEYTKSWDNRFNVITAGLNNDHYIENKELAVSGIPESSKHYGHYLLIPYYIYDTEDKITAYCIDPHLTADTKYKVDHILGANETNKEYDLGILEILKNGYNDYESAADNDKYMATSIAIRAFSFAIAGDIKNAENISQIASKAYFVAHVNLGVKWAKDLGYTGSVNSKYADEKYNFGGLDSSVMKEAYELFKKGIEAMNGEGSSPSIEVKESKDNEEVTIILNYKNFTKDKGQIVIGDLTCEGGSCGTKSVEGDITSDGYVTKNDGEIRVKFSVPSGDDCTTINYSLKYKYNDPNLEYIGALLLATNGNTEATQRFYAFQKGTEELIEAEAKGTIPCGEACKTNISEPICSTSESESTAKINTDEDIKKCILDNVDDAGNTYQFTSSAGGIDNDYCKVFCKEDYAEIRFNPIVEDVKCGGYFKLTSHIEGKKTCYTGGQTDTKQIDKEKFLNDIIDAQKRMIEAYDDYLNYTQANKDTGSESEECGGGCCNTVSILIWSTTQNGTDYEGYEIDKTKSNYETGEIVAKKVTKKHYADTSGGGGCEGGTPCENEGDRCCGSYTNTCKSGDPAEFQLEQKIKAAKTAYEQAYEDYKRILNDYNACTTGWVNEYPFSQKIKYYYDENRGGTENYTPYIEKITGSGKDELIEDENGIKESTTTISFCTGEADKTYECTNGKLPDKDESIENGSVSEYNYKSTYGEVFELFEFSYCTEKDGCKTEKVHVSQALFVKKEVEKKQDYITPTAFYQIAANGKITTAGDSYSGTDVQLEALTNALPVSTSTVGGGVFKLLIEDLGEFYDTKELGRLIDYEGDKESDSVIKAVGITSVDFKDGGYTCRYESPCRSKDCPDCIFTCEGDGCSWIPCEGDNCSDKCVSCIFNLGELSITHKTISTSNFNSAGRTFGYNWVASSSDPALALLVLKANKTISQIEEKNETIYGDTKDTENSEFAFSIKLTPEIISDIKAYNDSQSKMGGYINDSLTCYDATIDGTTYENIYCYSDYIDSLMEKYSGQMTFGNNRPNDKASRDSYSGDYWQLWTQNLEYIGSEDVIGGPSWR